MAIPSAVPPDSDLGKPLAAEHEIPIPAGALHGLRKLIVKCDLELDIPIRRNRFEQMHLRHCAIVFVVVVGMNVLQLRSKIALPYHFEAFDLFCSVAFLVPLFKVLIASSLTFPFAHPGRCRLKRIQIKMERKCIQRLPGEVVVSQRFSGIESMSLSIVLRVHVVSHYSLR